MSELGWICLGALCSIVLLATFFAICVSRLLSKFSSHALELARLSRAGSLREVTADEHSTDGPEFEPGVPLTDEEEATLEELAVQRREVKPHEVPGPRLRGEQDFF